VLETLAKLASPFAAEPKVSAKIGMTGPNVRLKELAFASPVQSTHQLPKQVTRLVALKRWCPVTSEEKRRAQDIIERKITTPHTYPFQGSRQITTLTSMGSVARVTTLDPSPRF